MKRFSLGACLLLASCAFCRSPDPVPWADDGALERSRMHSRLEMEAGAAVGRPGTFVCRQVEIGLSEKQWIRGLVVETRGNAVKVKIEDPGRFPSTVNGGEIRKGGIVRDSVIDWMPCIR